MRWTDLRNFLGLAAVSTLVALTVMVLLPHDKYLRYRALDDDQAPNAHWIYERINYDPAPIDIAFVGTSRTGMTIHTQRLEERLAAQGIHKKAANLHIVKTGYNMHYTIVKELLEHKKPELIVYEMTEIEDRKPHRDYIFLADASDIVFAPMVINLRYFNDLARLPGRQLDLFAETVMMRLGIGQKPFDSQTYFGSNMDRAEYVVLKNRKIASRTEVKSLEFMEGERTRWESGITKPLLPASLDWLEHRFPRMMVGRILKLAEEHGARVVFLYLPRYGGPAEPPQYDAHYADEAPLINPRPLMDSHELWLDASHANWNGAQIVTDYVAEQLVSERYIKPSPAKARPAIAVTR